MLAKFTKQPGVRVTVDAIAPENSDFFAFDIPGISVSAAHPLTRVTILILPTATVFSPAFWNNLPGRLTETGVSFPSGLEVYLVVAGEDKSVQSCTHIKAEYISDGDAPEMHFKITFAIAPSLMKHSYLMLNEGLPSGGYMIPIYFGSEP